MRSTAPMRYGTLPAGGGYDPARGAEVIAFARKVLNESAPLAKGRWEDAIGLDVSGEALVVTLDGGEGVGLSDPAQFAGFSGDGFQPGQGAAEKERSAY